MIHQKAITREWIHELAGNLGNADPLLVEKVTWTLRLLEGLVKQKVTFVFKGGTALMLHLDSTRRLSIDIDIMLADSVENLDQLLNNIAKDQGFQRWELQQRSTNTFITKEHYKFYYAPLRKNAGKEEFVLLDVLYENVHYDKLLSLPIESSFIPQKGEPLKVRAPSVDDLLADKLTAFAPNTTGIPYFKNEDSMSMEIIKQLYDIGILFDQADDIHRIKTTFERFARVELSYRNQIMMTPDDVLDDIIQTSLCLVTRGRDGIGNFDELQSGIQRVGGFIFSEKFHIEKAIIHASKAAWLASLLKSNSTTIKKYGAPAEMKDWTIREPMNTKLNKFKKSNPETFFYWYQIFKLTTS